MRHIRPLYMWECWSKYAIGQNTFYFTSLELFSSGERGIILVAGMKNSLGEQVDHSGVVKKEE